MKEGILQKWIEVTGHFDHETDGEYVFDCELPEDGQEILVTLIGGAIGRDICYIDKMGYHLESGWDWDDVFKWAPMPPAWWEENVHSRKGVFIPDITVEMFRNASLEGVEDFMTSGVMEDISLPSAQPEIIHCGECIYYDPPHVEKEDARYEYSEMPKEAFDVLGTGLVSMEYGINIGGRCCVDYYCKSYSDDKRVYVREDNYCGRAERRTDECTD